MLSSEALQIGLIDNVGSLEDTIAAAAARANIKDYEVEYVELPLSPRDMLMRQLANRVGTLNLWTASAARTTLSGVLGPMKEAAQELAILQDPAHLYMRCVACGLMR